MTQVRINKSFGFEQVGDSVDYRGGDLDERIAAGDVTLISAETVSSEPVVEQAPVAAGIPLQPEEKIETPLEEIQEVEGQ